MLRNYQSDILKRTAEAFNSHRSVMVQMPTGTGKTVVLACFLSEERRGKSEEPHCILIVAHRRELIYQINDTIRRLGIDSRNVVVESIQTISRRINSLEYAPSLVVIDEAHHALAKTYRIMWEAWPKAKFLGLTATPCRLSGDGFTDLFDVLVQSWSIGRFIKEGWLSAFDYYSIRPDSEDQRIVDSLEKRGADGDFQTKELNAVLNRKPNICRLFDSMCRYAQAKKGIVYAVSIGHAENIARYYAEHGVDAIAVSSKTPKAERDRIIEDFRRNRLQVLVSVDLFSEGFDCPDVEFIQLARPTLSLAKYLQMVGRGLRMSVGKACCVMIDNVGLYRLFGLPATDKDWQAMFEGRLAGKGMLPTKKPSLIVSNETTMATYSMGNDDCSEAVTDADLEEIVNHERLMAMIDDGSLREIINAGEGMLRAFKDRVSGRYGLKTGEKITATAQYQDVMDIRDGMAAVRFGDRRTGIVDANGNVIKRLKCYASVRLLGNGLLAVAENHKPKRYIDMKNDKVYSSRPSVAMFGQVEMLKVRNYHYPRTETPWREGFNLEKCNIETKGFCLEVSPYGSDRFLKMRESLGKQFSHSSICILADDYSQWYWHAWNLSDGTVIVFDNQKNFYHVAEGKRKTYLGNGAAKSAGQDIWKAMTRLKEQADAKSGRMQAARHKEMLTAMQHRAEPFTTGAKWGLRLDGRIIVPPIYRTILPAVGNYCAVETGAMLWGIILLSGQVVVEPKYEAVKINANGSAELTLYKGQTKKIQLAARD